MYVLCHNFWQSALGLQSHDLVEREHWTAMLDREILLCSSAAWRCSSSRKCDWRKPIASLDRLWPKRSLATHILSQTPLSGFDGLHSYQMRRQRCIFNSTHQATMHALFVAVGIAVTAESSLLQGRQTVATEDSRTTLLDLGSAASTYTGPPSATKFQSSNARTRDKASSSTSQSSGSSPRSHAGPQKSNGESSGISTGAAIGIGIGIAVVAILLLALLVFFCYRRRLREKREQASPSAVALDTDAERKYDASQPTAEKDSREVVSELATRANTHEIGRGDTRKKNNDERTSELRELPTESNRH